MPCAPQEIDCVIMGANVGKGRHHGMVRAHLLAHPPSHTLRPRRDCAAASPRRLTCCPHRATVHASLAQLHEFVLGVPQPLPNGKTAYYSFCRCGAQPTRTAAPAP